MLQKSKGKLVKGLSLKPFIRCHNNGINWTWRKSQKGWWHWPLTQDPS